MTSAPDVVSTRLLSAADVPSLREMAALAESEGFRFVGRFVDDLTAGRVRLDAPCEFFLGALLGGEIDAIGGVTPDPYIEDSRVGRLRHVYVRPERRRTGLGRTLVAELELRAESCYELLRLRTDTEDAAAFYERLGYDPVQSDSATHQRTLRPPSRERG